MFELFFKWSSYKKPKALCHRLFAFL